MTPLQLDLAGLWIASCAQRQLNLGAQASHKVCAVNPAPSWKDAGTLWLVADPHRPELERTSHPRPLPR